DVAPHSAVMIFPAAYLNSPSSMFGHTLLRIDQADVQSNKTALLSYAINFGAYIEGSDNSILYAWKGLMGGYPGLFALVPYQEKLSEYRSLENRDLWEYRLNLTQVETERMVEHVWELKQIQFDYFFFDENCSYRLLELLQVARPGLRLTEQFPLTAIPTDTVKAVKEAGLVEKIDYRPSRERELLERAKPLDSDEQQWVLKVSDDQKQLQEPAFKALPRERQALIIDAAAQSDARLRVIRRPNTGIVGALNDGLATARGRFIARMDGDDLSLPSRFVRQLDFLQANPSVALVGTSVEFIDARGARLKLHRPPRSGAAIRAALLDGNSGALIHPTIMGPRDVWQRLGGYLPAWNYVEDYDLFLRASLQGPLANLPEILLRYRIHAQSTNYRHRAVQLSLLGDRCRAARADAGLNANFTPAVSPAHADLASVYREWTGWATEGGEFATARHYAFKAWLRRPWQRENLRGLYRTLRQRTAASAP
ncbi:MAG: DUF4105 domain-containing protein, partial [Undibacterium sp.]|nr:DUF4105 domain-containing protein [Opitutaceae bacterium]